MSMQGLVIHMIQDCFKVNYEQAFDIYLDFKKKRKLDSLYLLMRSDTK